MDDNDLNIVGGTLVDHRRTFPGGIGIRGETIVYVGDEADLPPAKRVIDATGCMVMPGMIDAHVHVRAPSFPHREDFTSATAAAASGGVTTIVEMPVSQPPASDPDTVRARISHAEAHALVDFCFYAGVGGDNMDLVADLARCGVVGFKTFLMPPPEGREKEFYGLCTSDEALGGILKRVKAQGLLLAVHAEDPEIVERETVRVRQGGDKDFGAFCRSRPPASEVRAVRRLLGAQAATGTRVLLCHLSTPAAVEAVSEARAAGRPAFSETCPHYLLLSEPEVEHLGPFARVKPPLRSGGLRSELWKCFVDGLIDIVSSDHAPYLEEEKEKGLEDIWQAPDGIPALELTLPLLLTAVSDGDIDYPEVVERFSRNPARVLGLLPRKGSLAAGTDADVVIVEPGVEHPVAMEALFTKSRASARVYESRRLTHLVRYTLCRGTVVWEGGAVTARPGYGQFVRPAR